MVAIESFISIILVSNRLATCFFRYRETAFRFATSAYLRHDFTYSYKVNTAHLHLFLQMK